MTAPELSPSARALLDAAREGMSPDAAAISRVRGKVTAAAGGAAASALVIKLGLAGVLAAVAVGAIVSQRGEAPMTPQLALPVEAPSPITPITRVHEVAPVEAPQAAEPAPIEMAAVPMRRDDTAKLTVDIEPADLAREVELIDRAMKALATNDLRRALATVELHVAETRGAGQLAEDAAAIEIEALCRLRTSARTITAKLDAFDARFPRSAQRSRLSTHCEEN
jgi:hypothetical protein